MTGLDQLPMHVSLSVLKQGSETVTRLWVNGFDITRHVRSFRIEAGVGALTDVWLDLVGVMADVHAEVPQAHITQMSLEDEAAHLQAQQTVDVDRGKKDRQQHAILAISLGKQETR